MEQLQNKKNELINKLNEIENQIININDEIIKYNENKILSELKLSNQQREIIDFNEHDDILVIACPGSGKTHTLICKYIKIILNNIFKPEEILIITFTKKAGNELLNRLNLMLPNKLPYYIGTIHGLAFKILQEYNNINYTILDDTEYKKYINNIINNEEDIDKMVKLNITTIIEHVSSTYPFNLKKSLEKYNLEKYYNQFNKIYKIYQQKKKKENIIDFNDLMLLFSNYLENSKSDIFKNKIKYVFFDEYQDINSIQNNILTKLNSKLMLVGDDAQSIYSFRGSNIEYILNSDKTKFLLEENFRSSSNIVNFCQDIISHNYNQIKKNVKSSIKDDIKPILYGFKDNIAQYEWITKDIISKKESGIKLSDIVILARTNNILENIELHLLNSNINVSKHLGISLLDKSHIKDFIALITIIYNPKSSIHWKRIIGFTNNYTIKDANDLFDNNDLLPLKILKNKEEFNDLIKLYNKLIKATDDEKIKLIIIFFKQLWLSINDNNDNLNDLNKLLKYLKNCELKNFINSLYLNQEVETNIDNILYLTTIHGAKGLEWTYVYIIDSKPLIKSKFYLDEINEIYEERRLFYVAASRAKKCLIITYTNNKSQFLNEINKELYNNFGNNNLELVESKISLENYKILSNLKYDKIKVYEEINISISFLKYLIYKIVQINFPNKIQNFIFNLDFTKFPKKNYLEYIDSKNDWKYILEYIYYISLTEDSKLNKDKLLNSIDNYLLIEKFICNIINKIKPTKIICNNKFNIICDDTIIEFKDPTLENLNNTIQLCKKNNKIIFFNPIKGYLYNFS